MNAISTLLFLVTYYFFLLISPRSLNNFWNFPRCAKCKSLLHGPRNYVDRTCERSADYSARTFSWYRAKPKCNFAVRPLYDRSTVLGRLLQTVWVCFLEKKRKRNIVWEFSKMFETMVGVELLEGYKRAVCDTCRYSIKFLVKFHGEHPLNFSSLVSDSGLPYNNC